MIKEIKRKNTYMHKGNHKDYLVIDFVKIKIPDGNWIDGVAYIRNEQFGNIPQVYVRTCENFKVRFLSCQEIPEEEEKDAAPFVEQQLSRL